MTGTTSERVSLAEARFGFEKFDCAKHWMDERVATKSIFSTMLGIVAVVR